MPPSVSLPVLADEGMRSMLTMALSAHGLLDAKWELCADGSIPEGLLDACRLHCLTADELYLHDPLCGELRFSVSNEWRALLCARNVCVESPPTLHSIARALGTLCDSVIDGTLPAEDQVADMMLSQCLTSLGGDGRTVRIGHSAHGRGLVTTRSLATGDVAISMPASSLLCPAAAWRTPGLSEVLPLVDEGEWTEHVIVLLLLLHERQRGDASPWASWLRTLPTTFHNLDSWTAEQAAPLEGSPAFYRAEASRAELREIREALLPRLRAASSSAALTFAADAHTLDRWVWARAIIATRALALPVSLGSDMPEGSLAIAPIIDMCNHMEAAQAEITVDAARHVLCLRTVCAVPPGRQLCISYGALDADDLLLHHGIAQELRATQVGVRGEAGGEALAAIAPLRVPVSLAPCDELASHPQLLASVLLAMQHMGLALDGTLPEVPLGAATEQPMLLAAQPKPRPAPPSSLAGLPCAAEEESAVTAPAQLAVTAPAPTAHAPALEQSVLEHGVLVGALPLRLIGAARLCSISSADEWASLPIAYADGPAPLSLANEAAALQMLRSALEAQLWDDADLRAALGGTAVVADGQGSKESEQVAKRQRQDWEGATSPSEAERVMQERRELAQAYCWRRQRVLSMALAALDARMVAARQDDEPRAD